MRNLGNECAPPPPNGNGPVHLGSCVQKKKNFIKHSMSWYGYNALLFFCCFFVKSKREMKIVIIEVRLQEHVLPGTFLLSLPNIRGGSRIFIWEGGGAQKIMCGHSIEFIHTPVSLWHARISQARSPLRPGSRARLKALEALGFYILSNAIWGHFYAFRYKMGFFKKVDRNLGGASPCLLHHPPPPSLNPPKYVSIYSARGGALPYWRMSGTCNAG